MSDEIVREFLVEGNENLDRLDRELVQLEKDPQNRATLASVFRTIHTITLSQGTTQNYASSASADTNCY
jgi:two-component system, chemotaxis family, sensor kinase CheA